MLPRTILHSSVLARKKSRLPLNGVARSTFRVWPTDLDILRHMNNGKYLSIMDVARFSIIERNGIAAMFREKKWYPVVVAQTISYRKSLNPWMKFDIETCLIGFDDQAVYMEQRVVRPDTTGELEVYARAVVRMRILKRSGGVVPMQELLEECGATPEMFSLPEDVLQWGAQTRLPSTRAAAPSEWPLPVQ